MTALVSVAMRHHALPNDCHLPPALAAAYLGKSEKWLLAQVEGPHPPPSFRINRARLFRRSELDMWLEQFRESPPKEEEA